MTDDIKKQKVRERQKRYAEKHKDKVKAAIKKWNDSNKDKMLKASKDYYERNKDDVEFRLKNSLKTKEWSKNNPDKVLEQSSRKRATKLQRLPIWLTDDDKWIIQEIYRLAKDRTKLHGFEWHVDHIIPLRGKNVCGLHVPSNLRVIQKQENLRKSNKFLED